MGVLSYEGYIYKVVLSPSVPVRGPRGTAGKGWPRPRGEKVVQRDPIDRAVLETPTLVYKREVHARLVSKSMGETEPERVIFHTLKAIRISSHLLF